jgi:hypothetical protein
MGGKGAVTEPRQYSQVGIVCYNFITLKALRPVWIYKAYSPQSWRAITCLRSTRVTHEGARGSFSLRTLFQIGNPDKCRAILSHPELLLIFMTIYSKTIGNCGWVSCQLLGTELKE